MTYWFPSQLDREYMRAQENSERPVPARKLHAWYRVDGLIYCDTCHGRFDQPDDLHGATLHG